MAQMSNQGFVACFGLPGPLRLLGKIGALGEAPG